MMMRAIRRRATCFAWLLLLTAGEMHHAADAAGDEKNIRGVEPLIRLLAETDEVAAQRDILQGMCAGLQGRKELPMPALWPQVFDRLANSPDAQVREHLLTLALMFGDPRALQRLRELALDPKTAIEQRQAALETLIEKRAAGLAPMLQQLLSDAALRRTALRGLAAIPHVDTPAIVLERFADWPAEDQQEAIATLASRRDSALALLTAIDERRVPRGEVSAFIARQMFAMNDAALTARLRETWGEVREPPEEKQALIARYKQQLTTNVLRQANPRNGRLVFSKTCQPCHRLYGVGGQIGPDLTGAQRANLDYVLTNIVDPGATIGQDFRMSVVQTLDGRVLSGIVVERSEARVILQTATERVVLPADELAELRESPLSMMPEGQLERLTLAQIRDLIGYLATNEQVPLPADSVNDTP